MDTITEMLAAKASALAAQDGATLAPVHLHAASSQIVASIRHALDALLTNPERLKAALAPKPVETEAQEHEAALIAAAEAVAHDAAPAPSAPTSSA